MSNLNNSNKLQQQLSRWLNYVECVRKSSPRTLRSYTSDSKVLLSYCNQNNINSISELNTSQIHGYIEFMAISNSNSTINRRIASLNSFFEYMTAIGEVESNYTKDVKSLKVKQLTPKSLELDEALLLIEKANQRSIKDGLIVELLLFTGLRSFELSNIKEQDIRNGVLLITDGKGSKQREVPLNDYLLNRIEIYKRSRGIVNTDGFLFTNNHNNVLTEANVQTLVKNLMIKIGRSDLSCHKTRSTFATLLLSQDVNLATIQALLGHSSPTTTLRYLNTTKEIKQQAVLQNPLLSHMKG